MPSPCVHPDFEAEVTVSRLVDSGRFAADVRIHCKVCRLPFQFKGLLVGLDLEGACVSVDGLEARLAIVPQGQEPPPLSLGIRGFTIQEQ